jgi:hypothetical protein
MVYPLTALFAAVTTLLTPRAGEPRVGHGSILAVASGPEAEAGARPLLEATSLGQFILHEMRPFSEALLSSGDVAAFEGRLDDFIDGDLCDRFLVEVRTLVEQGWADEGDDPSATLPAALEVLRVRMVEALGERHAASIAEGLGSMLEVLSHTPLAGQVAPDDAAWDIRLSDLLSDVSVPLERRQAALAAMESTACYFALLHLVAELRVAPDWLADELIRRWTSGQAAVLRQIAIDGDPRARSRQEMNHALANEGYERLARRGEAEGADVWPPGAGNDD